MSSSGANVGRDAIVFFSLNQDNTVVPNDYKRLGAIRNKEFGPEWETVDATADDSPNNTRETLVTFKTMNVSLNGVTRQEELKNQDELEDYVISPANNQPCGWIRIQRPSDVSGETVKQYDIPVLFTSFRQTAAYDDVMTWAMEAPSNGATTITYLTP